MPFNTTAVPNGEHHLIVSVLDPAGNSAPVLDREINVQNPVPAAAPAPAVAPAKPTPKPKARITLKLTPRTVRRSRRVYFSGRLLGGHISKLGKLLALERQLRTGSGRGSLRSKPVRKVGSTGATGSVSLGPVTTSFGCLPRLKLGTPFATGWSRVVGVRVL